MNNSTSRDDILKLLENNTTFLRFIEKYSEYTVNRTLEKCGKIKPLLSKQEAYEMYNRPAVDRALRSNPCPFETVKKGGKTSNIYIVRKSFELWLLKDELASFNVKK